MEVGRCKERKGGKEGRCEERERGKEGECRKDGSVILRNIQRQYKMLQLWHLKGFGYKEEEEEEEEGSLVVVKSSDVHFFVV